MSRSNGSKHAAPRRGLTVTVVALAAALVAASGVLTAVVLASGPSSTAAAGTTPATASSTGAVHRSSFAVLASDPADDTTGIAPDAALSITFSAPLSASSPLPTIAPAVTGTWVRASDQTLAFRPAVSLPPGAALSVSVPGGSTGVQSTSHQHLAATVTRQFTVAPMSTLRLQQLLAQLGYLPLSFTPADATPLPAAALALDQVGTFAWRWSTLPVALTSLWAPGVPNDITRGAVMAFQDQHQLGVDGVAGPQVWEALLTAVTAGQADVYGHYDWVDVTTALPQHVTVWRDGGAVYSTAANTGIAAAPTAKGTWPVFARYTSTTMSGTNPDGSKYSDPGIPWVSYFHGGDALHGFIRPGYGYPQSLGCVEMPPSNAAAVYPFTPLGTLVTVE